MIGANPELLERSGHVSTDLAGDADECSRENPVLPGRENAERDAGASSTANAWLGLLIVVSSAAVVYGAIAACLWHFL